MPIRALAYALALGRVAFGAALVVAPRPATAVWTGQPPVDERALMLARGLGVRDLALGLGCLSALRADDRSQLRAWFAASGLSDATDGASTLAARATLPPARARAVTAVAAGSAVIGGVAAIALG